MATRNLKRIKMKMKMDRDWRKTLLRSGKDEILIDLDGDSQPDIALMDVAGNGNIDTIAMDLTGDGEFNLYFSDSDDNGIVDTVFLDEEGNGNLELLGIGREVEETMIAAANALETLLAADEFIAGAIEDAMDELDREIRQARKEMKKRR